MNLAHAIKPALDLIGHISYSPADAKPVAAAAGSPTTFPFDTAALNKIAGYEGEKLGSVYKFTVGRDNLHLTEMGATVNARMGLNSWAMLKSPATSPSARAKSTLC